MWTIKDLKSKGKAAFRANYGNSILVSLILGILLAAVVKCTANTQGAGEVANSGAITPGAIFACIGIASVLGLIGIAIRIFVQNPLIVGGYRFFLENSEDSSASAKIMLSPFKAEKAANSFITIFLTMLVRDIIIAIGVCIFIIPGVVLSYSYAMVPFILADHPEMSFTEVLKASRTMMKGNKWKTFTLDLSFIGWLILSAITCNLVGIFYVNPYRYATKAELYKAIK